MEAALERLVWERAANCCEYCRLPQLLSELTFHIDHIIAQRHGGATRADNLALACVHCNLHKGTDLSGIDPLTGKLTRLFHPRIDDWSKHFAWSGARLQGLTDLGRATIVVLAVNHPDAVASRESFLAERLFPPQT
jgi:hypothetical protein